MLERLIKRTIDTQIAELAADDRLLEIFFEKQYQISETETRALIEQYKKDLPTVSLHYPRAEATFPRYIVSLQSESEMSRGQFLNNNEGILYPEELSNLDIVAGGAPILGSFFTRTYSVDIYSKHPDLTLALYELAKVALLRATDAFNESSIYSRSFSGNKMRPIQQDEWGPDWLFYRTLVVETVELFEVIKEFASAFTTIDGLHISPGTGVETLVTTYVADVD